MADTKVPERELTTINEQGNSLGFATLTRNDFSKTQAGSFTAIRSLPFKNSDSPKRTSTTALAMKLTKRLHQSKEVKT